MRQRVFSVGIVERPQRSDLDGRYNGNVSGVGVPSKRENSPEDGRELSIDFRDDSPVDVRIALGRACVVDDGVVVGAGEVDEG